MALGSLLLWSCREDPLVPCDAQICMPADVQSQWGELGRHVALAVRSDSRRIVATYDATYTNLVVLVEQGDGSDEGRVVAGADVVDGALVNRDSGQWVSLALDEDDRAHLAWYQADEGALYHGILTPSGAWSSEPVDGLAEGNRGTYTSIAVGSDGAVHIAYRDETTRGLRYARRAAGGDWTSEIIDGCAGEEDCPGEGEDYGESASLVLVGDAPRIAFYDRLRGDLKMAAQGEEGDWWTTTLDGRDPETGEDTGDMGRFAQAAVDPKHRVGIAYYDATRGALRFLSPSGPSPHPVVVDDGVYYDETTDSWRSHPVGQHVALVFGEQGEATLVYTDAGRLVWKRADVLGSAVTGPVDLAKLEPGVDIALARGAGGQVRGALGALTHEGAGILRTDLVSFDLAAGAP